VRLADTGLAQLSGLPREEAVRKKIDLLAVYAYSGAEAARAPRIQTELSRAVLEAVDAGLAVEAAAGFHALSVLQFDSGDLGAAHQSTLRAVSVVGEAVPSKRADQLGGTARCLAMLERDLDDASAMYLEARAIADRARMTTIAIECAGGYLAAHAGQVVEARAMFERGLELARAREDRWSEFETLRALTQLELDAGLQVAALARSADLLEVAARMGDGSELAVARALDCLGRFSRNDEGAEGLFDEALAALRGADVKVAEERATEALRAAEAVSRRSQSALARSILARVALARGDVAAARLRVENVLPETERQKLSARARATLLELAGALAEARADLHRSPGAAS
jgi:tetratricopeptide (TPR) repeat protein